MIKNRHNRSSSPKCITGFELLRLISPVLFLSLAAGTLRSTSASQRWSSSAVWSARNSWTTYMSTTSVTFISIFTLWFELEDDNSCVGRSTLRVASDGVSMMLAVVFCHREQIVVSAGVHWEWVWWAGGSLPQSISCCCCDWLPYVRVRRSFQ